MKADFEKGTKICSRCKKELPIEDFGKTKSTNDGLQAYCKQCEKQYRNENKDRIKRCKDSKYNTFGRTKGSTIRGQSTILKRDYELTSEELERRNKSRECGIWKSKKINPQGILIWYDEKINDLDYKLYSNILNREYMRQRCCAIRGYIERVKPSEHFLFDFDLEQMLKDNVYYKNGNKKAYITKWWKGNIRHWTVKDGIWKE